MWLPLGGLGVALASPASAQDLAFDAHGASPIATVGDPTAPLRVWRPDAFHRGEWTAGGLFEVDNGLLYQRTTQNPDGTALLGGLIGVNLAGGYALSDRFAITANMPVWLSIQSSDAAISGGPGPGDLNLWAPIGLVVPNDDDSFGLSVVPWADLPTGAAKRLVGNQRPGFGAFAAVGSGLGPLRWSANLGFEGRPWSPTDAPLPGDLGRTTARVAAAVGVPIGETVGVNVEGTVFQDLSTSPIDVGDGSTQSPAATTAELALSARGRLASGLTFTAGVGPGLSLGLGTASFRGWAGVGWSGVPKRTLDIVDVNPPDAPTPAAFAVVDPEGNPVVGASVVVAGAPVGTTDADGKLAVANLVWKQGVVVRAPTFADATVEQPAEGTDARVQLAWKPTTVSFVVRDQTGANVPGTLSAVSGPGTVPAVPLGADGTAKLDLTPGTWTVAIESPGRGRQVRGITIVPGGPPQKIEAYLAPDEGDGRLGVTAIDDQGRPLDARVVVDGRPVGTTGGAGLLEVGDLAAGAHRVEIATEGFQTIELRDVAVKDDAPGAATIALQRVPGSVRVVAHGPDGKPANAVVRFDGPYKADGTPTGDTVRLAPQPLGDVGERIFILRPGIWQVLVASAELGVQQREVVVPETDTRLIVVDVVLQTAEDGEGRLAVRVVDPDGQPVDGAHVSLDDKEVGTTSTGGTVSLEGLVPGARKLRVSAEHFRDLEASDVLVTDGRAERVVTLAYEPGTVFVTARGPEGVVRDATARFIGPAVAPTLPLGGDGEEYTTLPAGAWTVFVASGHYGLQQRSIVVPEASRSRVPVEVVFTPAEGGVAELTVQVIDPEKNPVANAEIKLDGSDLGATSTGGAMTISELDTGPRKLEVAAEPYVTKSQALSLQDGGQVVPVALDWAPGATRVVVTGPSGPVTDAIVRLAGPSVMPARPVDGDGKRLFALSPGKWSAVVLSPSLGMAQKEFEIPAGKKGLTTVSVSLDALGAGESELMVRVQDPDGRPVSGAQIAIGGAAKGKTTAGGALLIGSLEVGKTTIDATAAGFLPLKVDAAQIGEGSQERVLTLQFEPRTVTVVVKDPKGAPLDAEIRFDGPAPVDPKPAGADGTETFQLRPGTWQVLAGTAELGTVRKEITLERTTGPQTVEFTLNPKKVDVSAESVVIHEQVMFDFNSSNLRPEGLPILDEVAATILAHPNVAKVQVQGHTDDVGSVEVNFKLSQDRAAAVVAALIARGVPPERLEAQGYGATRPVTPNTDDASRQQNRRVQFEIVEKGAEK